ncbi:MAG: META domain-containing protein, partial [Acidimicrobiia bacterium]|nr:META domain-containing protein [Acidimicrobiia bacterium]
GMTLMACMPPLDQQEQDITRALQSVDAWDPVGDAATLLADGETVMVLHKIDTKLEGTAWVITGVNNGTGGVTSLIATSEPSIEFGAEDRFTMNTGCNTASGTYTTDGTSAVAFEQVITTEMACLEPEGLMDQERMLLDALATTTTYEITGVTITFRDDDGAARFTGRLTESPLP